MKKLNGTLWILLAFTLVMPTATLAQFEVVAALGVLEPSDLTTGQTLDAGSTVKLEPWGRAVFKETSECKLTHVVVGASEYQLAVTKDCSAVADPRQVAAMVQLGQAFAERLQDDGTGLAASLVTALGTNPCVYLPRVSEEGDGRRYCPSGYALSGFGCLGNFCDDKVLMCCPYLDGEPDPSSKQIQARRISEEFPHTATTKHFMNGLACDSAYCDGVTPHSFKSEHLKNSRQCAWSPWISESDSWIQCGDGQFVAGIRCKGDYCGDLGIHCCRAEAK